mgnify:CR=1 FL=1
MARAVLHRYAVRSGGRHPGPATVGGYLDGVWREEKVQDQLTDEEIARQWEYSVSNPNTPELIEELADESEDEDA